MPQASNRTQLTLHNSVLEPLKPYIPERKSLTQFVEDLLEKQLMNLDTSTTMGKPSAREVLPLNKAVNKEKDVDFSLRAEEAHVDVAVIKSPPKRTKEIPGNLFPHADLIKSYWKVKGGKKSDHAWTRQMNQLTKLQELYGDQVVIAQLEEGRAKGWEAVEVRKYEQYGLPQANTPTQTSEAEWERLNNIRTPW